MAYFRGFIAFFQFLFVFSSVSLRELFTSSLMGSKIFINLFLKSFYSEAFVFEQSSLAVEEQLGSGGATLFFMLLNVFLHKLLPI